MLNVRTYFADTVAAGCAPRYPCVNPAELATLEASAVRGDCISPLLQEGDTIYIDRIMKPQPGDVVSFALSQRGADAQNSDLPAGQTPWAPGSRWCKLLGIEHGFQMLYDRHGASATATLMACESPDDVPVLHPVRQVRRNGRLLFGPDSHSGQLGLNAATTVGQRFLAGPVNVSGTGAIQSATVDSFAIPVINIDCILQMSVSYQVYETNIAGTQVSDLFNGTTASNNIPLSGTSSAPMSQAINYQFSYTASSSITLALDWGVVSPGGPNSATYSNIQWRYEFIKR